MIESALEEMEKHPFEITLRGGTSSILTDDMLTDVSPLPLQVMFVPENALTHTLKQLPKCWPRLTRTLFSLASAFRGPACQQDGKCDVSGLLNRQGWLQPEHALPEDSRGTGHQPATHP